MKKFFTLLFLSVCFFSAKSQVVISQIYGGGGNAGATYTHDFIELFNRGAAPVSLNGWSVQYASATGTTWQVTNLPNFTLQPGQYFLIQEAQGAGGTTPLPTPDVVPGTPIPMSATAGKVALVNSTTALTIACPTGASIIDFIGFGPTANCFEGTAPAPAPSNTTGDLRGGNGCTDAGDNSTDFTAVAPVPRNSASPFNVCGGGSSLSASALTAFGNVCINTTAGPNSFTITGTNLTTASVTVAALTGFTYSTTSGGTYTSTLTLPSTGGAFSQQVFVKFDPTAVQSYSGSIAVGGGGATSINVAASGAGVNSIPTVTSGIASAITTTSATVAGTIPSIGCSALTANYGIEWSLTNGFANGTGTAVLSTNLAAGAFTSNLSGLAPATTYYYHAFATNAAGTGYGVQGSFTTVSPNPTITTTALASFPSTCLNFVGTSNTFTINGTNLTNANVTVAALNGYSYSTAVGGPYTATLSLTQPGGTYSQLIYVRFVPTAVQSYNGNIQVGGGGTAAPVNVAAVGSGSAGSPSMTSPPPAATSITQTSAVIPGLFSTTGCTTIPMTAYGVEYSTTNNFPTGTGTQVAGTGLAGNNYTTSLTGLAPATTYYYRNFGTNAYTTVYSTQGSFTTVAPTLSVTTPAAFGAICVNNTAGPNSFTISGTGLTTANVLVGALAGFTYSTTASGTYTATLSLTQPGGTYSQQIFVKFTPTAIQSYNGNIPVSGGGSVGTTNVAVVGSGVNTTATVSTGTVAGSNNNSAVLNGSIANNGCSNVTAYGIEFSGINGFLNGNGTQVPSNNLAGGNFSSSLSGLVQGATYYYKAYATNAGGTAYGSQQSFTVPAIETGFHLYPSPVERGNNMRITVDNLTPGYYGLLLFDAMGRLVFQHDMHVQSNFINQEFKIPGHLQTGIYRAYLVNFKERIGLLTIMIQ